MDLHVHRQPSETRSWVAGTFVRESGQGVYYLLVPSLTITWRSLFQFKVPWCLITRIVVICNQWAGHPLAPFQTLVATTWGFRSIILTPGGLFSCSGSGFLTAVHVLLIWFIYRVPSRASVKFVTYIFFINTIRCSNIEGIRWNFLENNSLTC